MNFTETREAINFTSIRSREQIMNKTLWDNTAAERETGDNIIFNDTETREFEFVVNGKNCEKNDILMEGLICISGVCTLDAIEEVELMEGQYFWSDESVWDGAPP